MNKKCPDCGSLNVEEVFDGESYCKDCFLHCATDDLEDASVFDRITQSPEVLAGQFIGNIYNDKKSKVMYYSMLTQCWYNNKEDAFNATVAKLKEVEG